MESSDEEGEVLPMFVTDYHFVDHNDKPISFYNLPIQWHQEELMDMKIKVYLCGTAVDRGHQKIYKSVVAWKYDLSYSKPQISVLSKNKKWITLRKPKNNFESYIRTIYITIHCLHFVKRNPEALWTHFLKTFSKDQVDISEHDLLPHMKLISQAAKKDKDLAESKYLVALMKKCSMTVTMCEDIQPAKLSNFIVHKEHDDEGGEDDEQIDSFDPVCAICDNGGSVLCCDGVCLRSFHATVADGIDSSCESLGYTRSQVDAMPSFTCKNCMYKQHQCFACGKLGSSDSSSVPEVFPCVSVCGRFYHSECVAKLLHVDDKFKAEELKAKISVGESFTCPLHKCFVCKKIEVKDVTELQFAVCRRCPKAYHRKCLPRKISFGYNGDENTFQRAWSGLLPDNRILIYCMNHKINGQFLTPVRDHLIFPGVEGKHMRQTPPLLSVKEKLVLFKRDLISKKVCTDRTVMKKPKQAEKLSCSVDGGAYPNILDQKVPSQDFDPLKKPNILEVRRKFLKDICTSSSNHSLKADKNKLSTGVNRPSISLESRVVTSDLQRTGRKVNGITPYRPVKKKLNNLQPNVDTNMEKGILAIIEEVTSSFDADEFMKTRSGSTYAYRTNNVFSKTTTLGMVESSVKAARTALKMLKEKRSEDDAKAVCDPKVLGQLFKQKAKLEVRLAPFLHGMRYTSFGRHFTKIDKLKQIVDRLHYYVQNGDMIVDFCCGSNDFSCLMKEKLEKMGKTCFFKNYDLIHTKNDFCFEKRNWMSVNVEELPIGSQLIIGLNPPFGVKAALANEFVKKALQFKPKLVILIVPRETKGLDQVAGYDLVWEDDQILSGKSFYLPGSIDVNDKQIEQWNLKTPPLYLWSRPDWTIRHKVIARNHGHIDMTPQETHNIKNNFNYYVEDNQDCYGEFFTNVHAYGNISNIFDGVSEIKDSAHPPISRGYVDASRQRSICSLIGEESTQGLIGNNSTDKQPLTNLNEVQYKGRGEIETLVHQGGYLDEWTNLETDNNMCIDMDLGSPYNFQVECPNLENMFVDRPPEAHDTIEMKVGETSTASNQAFQCMRWN